MSVIYKLGSQLLNPRRLDPWHYQPEFVRKIRQIGETLQVIELNSCIDQDRGVASGATPLGANYLNNGRVRFYRTSEVDDMFLDHEQAVYITDEDDEKLARSRLSEGDVLLTITGAKFGKSAVVTRDHLPGNISQHSVRFRPNNSIIDPYFLVAYLNGLSGQVVIWREAYGATRPAIDFPSVRSLTVPLVSERSQKYIGDKVRQAELLRAWAKKVEADITAFHQQLIPDQSKLDFSRKTRFVGCSRMTERFDAHFYPGVVEDYLSLKNCGFKPLGELASTVFNGQTQDETEGAEAVEQITVANLSRTYINGQPRRVIKPSNSSKLTKKHDLLICNAAHNKSYIGRDVTYYHSEKLVLPSTEVMVIRVDRELLPASFVRSYLLTQIGFVQIQSTIRGITAHSYPVDMKKLDIPIPSVPDSIKHDWFACDDRMALAGQACEVATRLTNTAKFLVEALIEGVVTEQQLICAQQALDVEDNSLDRNILGRLTTKGLDSEGDPLFADLDQLYDLLAQCQQMDE